MAGPTTPRHHGHPRELGSLRGLAAAGAMHLQLVLDPITAESIDTIGAVLADLDRCTSQTGSAGTPCDDPIWGSSR